jgi:cytochrome c1
LPVEWRDTVIAPLDFVEYCEYEILARRCLGYDIDGETCYYAHGYALAESRSDDDEDFYQVVAYSETVHAWRMRDERWLIHRIVHHCGDGTTGRGFYSFAEHCPR